MAPPKYKSAERITDSDAEDDAPAPKAPPAKKKAAPAQQKPKQQKPSAAPPAPAVSKKKQPPPPPADPSSDEDDSSSGSEEEGAAPAADKSKKPAAPAAAESADSASSSDEADESSDEEGDSSKPTTNDDSDSDDDDSSDAESSVSNEPAAQGTKRKADGPTSASSPSKRARNNATSPAADAATAAAPEIPKFAPPAGFVPAQLGKDGGPALALLTDEALAGKEIWHITAPGSVPLDGLQHIDPLAMRKGKKILSHGGADYGLFELGGHASGSASRVPRMLVPNAAQGGAYAPLKASFDKSFNIQQILPEYYLPSPRTSVPPLVTEKPVVQQPPDLKKRFFPPGFEPESERAFVPPPAMPSVNGAGPAAASQSKKAKKSKDAPSKGKESQIKDLQKSPEKQAPQKVDTVETNGVAPAHESQTNGVEETSKAKKRKHKHSQNESPAIEVPASSAETPAKKKKKDKHSEADADKTRDTRAEEDATGNKAAPTEGTSAKHADRAVVDESPKKKDKKHKASKTSEEPAKITSSEITGKAKKDKPHKHDASQSKDKISKADAGEPKDKLSKEEKKRLKQEKKAKKLAAQP